jgi:hypothetical protein
MHLASSERLHSAYDGRFGISFVQVAGNSGNHFMGASDI